MTRTPSPLVVARDLLIRDRQVAAHLAAELTARGVHDLARDVAAASRAVAQTYEDGVRAERARAQLERWVREGVVRGRLPWVRE